VAAVRILDREELAARLEAELEGEEPRHRAGAADRAVLDEAGVDPDPRAPLAILQGLAGGGEERGLVEGGARAPRASWKITLQGE
jgi:hypothetical protein